MVPFPFPFDEGFCWFCGAGADLPWVVLPCRGQDCGALDLPALAVGSAVVTPGKVPGVELRGFDLFTPGTSWVAAAEPPDRLAAGMLRFAALSRDGSQVTDALWFDGKGLQTLDWSCPFGKCSQPPGPFFAAAPLSLTAAAPADTRDEDRSPVPRNRFVSAMSATEASLFVVGGRDSAGRTLKDVWSFDIMRARWLQISTFNVQLGDVLAAAWSPVDRALYVLDETKERGVRFARLLRNPPRPRGARGGPLAPAGVERFLRAVGGC